MKKILCLLLAVLTLLSLCACGQSAAPAANDTAPAEADAQEAPEEAPDVTYEATVTDADGNPIPGVKLQFCDDVSCSMVETNENGTAAFTAKEGSYTVHVLTVPGRFLSTEEEFTFTGTDREVNITLDKPEPAVDKPNMGFSYYNPEAYENLKGFINWDEYQVTDFVYILAPIYFALESDDTANTEALMQKAQKYQYLTMFELLCVLKNESAAEEYLKEELTPAGGWDSISIQKIGSAEKVTCFLVQAELSEDDLKPYRDSMGELYDEYAALCEDPETFISGIELKKPVFQTLLFETQDFDGNAINIADVYSGCKVTMVNLWTTGCGPCIEEMPGLEKLNKAFGERECQIIGICLDCFPGDDASKALGILEKAGVSYLNLPAPKDNDTLHAIDMFPTSFFVDSEGRILTRPVAGAYKDVENYTYHLESALAMLEE